MNISLHGMNTAFRSVETHDPTRLSLMVFSGLALLLAGLLARPSFESIRPIELRDVDLNNTHLVSAEPVVNLVPEATQAKPVPATHPVTVQSEAASAREVSTLHRDLVFARAEHARYGNLLTTLRHRMAEEKSPVIVARMKLEIANLEDRLNDLHTSIQTLTTRKNAASDPFAREDLHESLLALQDAGHRAVDIFVDGDNLTSPVNDSQVFNVSRTGQ